MIDVTGTVAEVLEAVGDDPTLAAEALELERAGRARKSLVGALEAIASPAAPASAAADNAQASAPGPEPAPLVRGRWISPQAVYAVEQGVVLYGDPFMVTVEQLEDPASPVVAWDDGWMPDEELWRQSRLYDADDPAAVPAGMIHNPRSVD